MTLKEAALEYCKQGYKVFPCYPKTKIPATHDGFHSATDNTAQVEWWWSQNPNYNIAIATGAASNLTVVDIDGPEGWESAKSLNLPKATVSTPTGGGHIYYNYSDIKNTVRSMPGLDTRCEGGYVVAAPSIHPDGGAYALTGEDKQAAMSDGLKSIFIKRPPTQADTAHDGADIITEGRNNYLTKQGGLLRRAGHDEAIIYEMLQALNQVKCDPPLPDREVHNIAKSVSRYAPDQTTLEKLINVEEAPVLERSGTDLVKASSLIEATRLYLSDKDKVRGMPTGLDTLDYMLGGGKRTGEVTCWHAEAKTGKNTFWHYLQYMWLELGIPVGYASRELSPESEVLPNLLSIAFEENTWLADMTPDKVNNIKDKLTKWPLYFSEGYGYFPLSDIVKWVDNGIAEGIRHFWFDHLHYMLEDPEDHKTASKLIKELKTLAKQRDIHIDIIIQPNKLSDGQKLSLNSIKGGAAMGQAIDNLIILERVKVPGVKNVNKLTLEVARSKLCKPGSMYIEFNGDNMSFIEVSAEEAAPSIVPADTYYPAYEAPGMKNVYGKSFS